MKLCRLILTAFSFTLVSSAVQAQVGIPDIYKYVEPSVPFDEPAAQAQLEPGTATIRGTLTAKEGKALIKALNMSKSHKAYKGTVVTLMPHSAYIDAWLALNKKLRKSALEKAALSAQANSYRILTKVYDDQGSFAFPNLKPGKYFIYADVDFTVAGSSFVQTGTLTTSNAVTGQVLASQATGYYEPFAVNVSKFVTGIVTVSADGQIVEANLRGQ